tara:strand:+ start:2124 stop:2723 length:600 start_codon:yes stop_codon:yes gene_type:complete
MDTDTHQPFDNYFESSIFNNCLTYYYFKGGFSPEECTKIIDCFSPVCTSNAHVFEHKASELRKTKVCWIPRNSTTQWIYDRLISFTKTANNDMYKFDLTGLHDTIQFTLYDSENGEAFYRNHLDLGKNDIYSCRKISVSVQLSDGNTYNGADLKIKGTPVPRDQGCVITFPSFSEHEVTPIVSGKRYSLVLWVYGPHFK